MFYQKILNEFVSISKNILGNKLTGIYLHGSMAMGCFNPDKSDIDLLIVIERDLEDREKIEFLKEIMTLNNQLPKNGFEVSLVKRQVCKPFIYPTSFELHFSPMHVKWFKDDPDNYVKNMKGLDKDLAAHFTIIKKYGIVLYGEGIDEIFGQVPTKNYVESIWLDVKDGMEDIIDKPIYVILNTLRVLAFLREGFYLSKEEAGQWGMENLGKRYQPLIFQALDCYKTNQVMDLDREVADEFVGKILSTIRLEISKKFSETLC